MESSGEKSTMQNPPPYSGNPPPYEYGHQPHQPHHPMPGPHHPMPGPPMQQYGPAVVQATVYPTVVPMVVAHQMSPKPTHTTCRSCNMEIVTRVEMKTNMRTHLFAALLCLLGFWPCACLPYCIDSCNNADHYCPNCSAYIGSYIS